VKMGKVRVYCLKLDLPLYQFWMFTQTCIYVFTQLCQCYLEPKKVRGPSPFCFGYFFSSKKFNYVAKDANTLHLKLGSGDRPNYFSISTPLGHDPHCHG
jgi:hypothetical protein